MAQDGILWTTTYNAGWRCMAVDIGAGRASLQVIDTATHRTVHSEDVEVPRGRPDGTAWMARCAEVIEHPDQRTPPPPPPTRWLPYTPHTPGGPDVKPPRAR